jgi:hypothetical protein
MTNPQQQREQLVDGVDLKAIEDYIYSTMNHTPEWKRAEQAYQNILTARSRPHTPEPELPENYWHCPFRKGCEDGESWCSWPCDKWAVWHDAAVTRTATLAERERVLDELDSCIQKDMEKTAKGFHLHDHQDSERYEHIRIENHIRNKITSLRQQEHQGGGEG